MTRGITPRVIASSSARKSGVMSELRWALPQAVAAAADNVFLA